MKRIFLSVVMSGFLSSAAFAQIPVTDVAQNAQTMAHNVATVAQWAKDIAEMKAQFDMLNNQYQQMEKEYDTITGSRGLGNIMNDPAFRDYLPSEWQGVYDAVRDGGYAGLSGRAQEVYAENRIFDSCAAITVQEQRTACEARAVKGSQDKGFALEAYDAAKNRIGQIDQLMGQINATQDPKDIAELQGRIAAEQANIQNEQTKLQLYSMVAAAEEKVQAQRQREIQAKTWSAKKGIAVQPLTFD